MFLFLSLYQPLSLRSINISSGEDLKKKKRTGYDVWMVAILIAAFNAPNQFSAGLTWLLSCILK